MRLTQLFHRKNNAAPDPQAVRPFTPEIFRAVAASQQPFFAAGLDGLSKFLPARDAELHRWLEKAIEGNDPLMFVYTISAAAAAGRTLPATLLPRGTGLMRNNTEMGWIAMHCEGDVTEALWQAVCGGGLAGPREATALFYASAWWQKHREGPVPAKIVSRAREVARDLAREKPWNVDTLFALNALRELIGSDELEGLIPLGRDNFVRRTAAAGKKALLEMMEAPFLHLVPEKPETGFTLGRPMRRAVKRIGRNQPCPCANGKKYKDCCWKEDARRLQQSSDVPGLTILELHRELDDHLTKVRLEAMPAHDVARLAPAKVPAELVSDYLARLAFFKRYAELARAFKHFGVEGEREEDWMESFAGLVKDWRRDLATRWLKMHPRKSEALPKLPPAARILLQAKDAARFCQALETEALAALQSGDLSALQSVATGALFSPFRALGILVARSVLPLGEKAAEIFEEILHARDKLNLPPDDEFADFMEERAAGKRRGKESAQEREDQAELAAKAAEMRRVREELATLKRDAALREKREKQQAALTPQSAAPAKSAELLAAREKEKEHEALIRALGRERIDFRRKLKERDREVEALKAAQPAKPASPELDEEEGGEPFQEAGIRPIRLISFPSRFHETLARFPQHVGRAVLKQLGQIGAGEEGVFKDIVKVYACEDMARSRVAADYRLLLRLTPTQVEVVELVNRRDLIRRLKVLSTTAA